MSPAAEAWLHQFASTDAFNDYIVSRLALYVNCNLLDGIPKVDGTYSLYLREPIRIEENLLKASRDPNRDLAPLLDFLAVTQITAPGEYYEWTNRPGALPMVTAGQRAVFADQNATFRALADPGFAPTQTVYLPLESKPFVSITNRTEATIAARKSESNREEIEVVVRQPSLVVIAQDYYHLWRASVDGRPENIWRANLGYQAIQVSAGHHHVTLLYRDVPFYRGLLISCLTLAACVSAWFYLRERRSEFNVLMHAVIPLAGIAAFVPAFFTGIGVGKSVFSFVTKLPAPFTLVGPIDGIGMGVGVVYMLYLYATHPERIRETGRIFLEEPGGNVPVRTNSEPT